MRKSLLYTGFTLILLLLFFIVFSIRFNSSSTDNSEELFINQLAFMIDTDLPRAARIASIRSFLSMEDYCARHAVFLDNTSLRFREALLNGTINNESIPLIVNDSLYSYSQKLERVANSHGFNLNLSIYNVSLYQLSPWVVGVSFNIMVNISSIDKSLWMNYNKSFNTSISIVGLRDPLFSVGTNGRLHNVINRTIYHNYSEFDSFAKSMLYIENPDAPSFLQRFEGNLNASIYGIEAMVNLNELALQGLSIDNTKSIVDHLYFSNQTNTADWCYFENMSDWIKIDSLHGYFYGLNNTNYINCS